MTEFIDDLVRVLDKPDYLRTEYLKKCEKESGYSSDIYWKALNDAWQGLRTWMLSVRRIPKREESDGEGVQYDDGIPGPLTMQHLVEIWHVLYNYRIAAKQGKLLPFSPTTMPEHPTDVPPEQHIQLLHQLGVQYFRTAITNMSDIEDQNLLFKSQFIQYLRRTPTEYHGAELERWWASQAAEHGPAPEKSFKDDKKDERTIPTQAMLGLLCACLSDSGVLPMLEKESNDKFVRRVCKYYSLDYNKNSRRYVTTHSDIYNYVGVAERLLPFLPETDRMILEEYIERKIAYLKGKRVHR